MFNKNNQYQQYLMRWASVLALIVTIVAVFNYFIDPYGFFDSPRIDGLNRLKPGASTRDRVVKPYMVDFIQPKTIIAGNSRPLMGLDPSIDCWPDGFKPIYNMGMPGASVYLVSRNIHHAISGNNVEHIYWGLDFIDFLSDKKKKNLDHWPPKQEPFEERLRVNADGSLNANYKWMRVQDYLSFLFSIDALNDSIVTILSQSKRNSETVRRDGFNPAREYLDIMALEGQGFIFKQKGIALTKIFNDSDLTLLRNDSHPSIQYESLRQILNITNSKNIKTILFINPYHSDYLGIIRLAGLWNKFLLWKKDLTKLADNFNVQLWDFSVLNEPSLIQPPNIGDKKTLLKWFWEPAHYRKQYGNLMLSQLLSDSCGVQTASANGVKLEKSNIDNHLRNLTSRMLHFESDFPLAIKRLSKLKRMK